MFRFFKSNFLAVGTFNIYVLQPNWFAQVELVRDGQEVTLLNDFGRPGYGFRDGASGVEWGISPDKVIVSSDSPEVDCGEKIRRVVETLEWTPLHAVGGNVTFQGDREDYDLLRVKPPIPDDEAAGEWKQSATTIAIERDGRMFGIAVAVTDQKVVVTANFHTDLGKIEDRTERLGTARAACGNFMEDRQTAVSLIARLFGVEIEHDDRVSAV